MWVVVFLFIGVVSADQGCYGGADIAGTFFGTLLATLLAVAIAYYVYKRYSQKKRARKAILDAEKGDSTYAFDNPYFKEDDSIAGSPKKQQNTTPDKVEPIIDGSPVRNIEPKTSTPQKQNSSKKLPWSPFSVFAHSRSDRRRAFDDTYVADIEEEDEEFTFEFDEPEQVEVNLKGHDFTGLGFNICGSMRDGIFVKDVLHRGPASESGKIRAGDRILSVTVSFSHMVYEDALTILSYASPYDVLLRVEKGAADRPRQTDSIKSNSGSQSSRICHPFYRSQSIDDLSQIGKSSLNAKRSLKMGVIVPKNPSRVSVHEIATREQLTPTESQTGSLNEKLLSKVIADEKPSEGKKVEKVVEDLERAAKREEEKKIFKANTEASFDQVDGKKMPADIQSSKHDLKSEDTKERDSAIAIEMPVTQITSSVVDESNPEKTQNEKKVGKFGVKVLPEVHFKPSSQDGKLDEKVDVEAGEKEGERAVQSVEETEMAVVSETQEKDQKKKLSLKASLGLKLPKLFDHDKPAKDRKDSKDEKKDCMGEENQEKNTRKESKEDTVVVKDRKESKEEKDKKDEEKARKESKEEKMKKESKDEKSRKEEKVVVKDRKESKDNKDKKENKEQKAKEQEPQDKKLSPKEEKNKEENPKQEKESQVKETSAPDRKSISSSSSSEMNEIDKIEVDTSSAAMEKKEDKGKGFMSKGLRGLKDLKGKFQTGVQRMRQESQSSKSSEDESKDDKKDDKVDEKLSSDNPHPVTSSESNPKKEEVKENKPDLLLTAKHENPRKRSNSTSSSSSSSEDETEGKNDKKDDNVEAKRNSFPSASSTEAASSEGNIPVIEPIIVIKQQNSQEMADVKEQQLPAEEVESKPTDAKPSKRPTSGKRKAPAPPKADAITIEPDQEENPSEEPEEEAKAIVETVEVVKVEKPINLPEFNKLEFLKPGEVTVTSQSSDNITVVTSDNVTTVAIEGNQNSNGNGSSSSDSSSEDVNVTPTKVLTVGAAPDSTAMEETDTVFVSSSHTFSTSTPIKDDDIGRRSCSLGDLYRLNQHGVSTTGDFLERAVSLDLRQAEIPIEGQLAHKKRKAPQPPDSSGTSETNSEDCITHAKEPRLETMVTSSEPTLMEVEEPENEVVSQESTPALQRQASKASSSSSSSSSSENEEPDSQKTEIVVDNPEPVPMEVEVSSTSAVELILQQPKEPEVTLVTPRNEASVVVSTSSGDISHSTVDSTSTNYMSTTNDNILEVKEMAEVSSSSAYITATEKTITENEAVVDSTTSNIVTVTTGIEGSQPPKLPTTPVPLREAATITILESQPSEAVILSSESSTNEEVVVMSESSVTITTGKEIQVIESRDIEKDTVVESSGTTVKLNVEGGPKHRRGSNSSTSSSNSSSSSSSLDEDGLKPAAVTVNDAEVTPMAEAKNITVMAIRTKENVAEELKIDVSEPNGKLLNRREDSKSRLMQTVQDAHEIKVTPLNLSPRRNSLGSPVSVEIPVIPPVVRLGTPSLHSPPESSQSPTSPSIRDDQKEVIEITHSELDGVMMSHRHYLLKQAQSTGMYTPENAKNKEQSFDQWVFVDGQRVGDGTNSRDTVTVSTDSRNERNGPVNCKVEMDTNGAEETLRNGLGEAKEPVLPQKSMTHITLGGPQYTVTEGAISRTVIISNPELSTQVNSDVSAGPDSPPPNLEPAQ